MVEPVELKIKYVGKLSETYPYRGKRVELPVPFTSKSEKLGEVICDPVGIFPYADGMRLLENSGGMFELVEKIYPEGASEIKTQEPVQAQECEYYDHVCACGCGGRIPVKPNHKYTGIPKYLAAHAGRKKKVAPSPEKEGAGV